MTSSIMEDFGYIASRLAEIRKEKQDQLRGTEQTTEPKQENDPDIWSSGYLCFSHVSHVIVPDCCI